VRITPDTTRNRMDVAAFFFAVWPLFRRLGALPVEVPGAALTDFCSPWDITSVNASYADGGALASLPWALSQTAISASLPQVGLQDVSRRPTPECRPHSLSR
jgi:hypothetical protein